ncbi:MAG: 2-C-methyl-D-erythritol 2,4-cyclodiphosphate synthase [Acidobacteriota bacterium]
MKSDAIPWRVGLGYDFHPFEEGRRLVLGGIEVPGHLGLKGHSDADPILHAVADALLGAAGLKDLGSYFPDDDPRYRDISSLILLEKVYRLIRGKGFVPGNVDLVVMAERPKIQPWVEAIKANLSRVLHLDAGSIGVKATTMEGKGPIGRGEGIGVQAAVLVARLDSSQSSRGAGPGGSEVNGAIE